MNTIENIAKAAISTLMDRQTSIMVTTMDEPDMVRVSYFRDDGSQWIYDVILDEDRVVWRTVSEQNGRWRNHEMDEVLRFRLPSPGTVVIKMSQKRSKTRVRTFRFGDL